MYSIRPYSDPSIPVTPKSVIYSTKPYHVNDRVCPLSNKTSSRSEEEGEEEEEKRLEMEQLSLIDRLRSLNQRLSSTSHGTSSQHIPSTIDKNLVVKRKMGEEEKALSIYHDSSIRQAPSRAISACASPLLAHFPLPVIDESFELELSIAPMDVPWLSKLLPLLSRRGNFCMETSDPGLSLPISTIKGNNVRRLKITIASSDQVPVCLKSSEWRLNDRLAIWKCLGRLCGIQPNGSGFAKQMAHNDSWLLQVQEMIKGYRPLMHIVRSVCLFLGPHDYLSVGNMVTLADIIMLSVMDQFQSIWPSNIEAWRGRVEMALDALLPSK